MIPDQTYHFESEIWLYKAEKAAWHFATLPVAVAEEIRFFSASSKRGWGSVPVTVTIGDSIWKTSIFPYKPTDSYILPLKAEIRRKQEINVGDTITIHITVRN